MWVLGIHVILSIVQYPQGHANICWIMVGCRIGLASRLADWSGVHTLNAWRCEKGTFVLHSCYPSPIDAHRDWKASQRLALRLHLHEEFSSDR